MRPPPQPFQHLPLILRHQGPARIPGGGGTSAESKANKQAPGPHSRKLGQSTAAASESWESRQSERRAEGLETLAAGMPLLLRIDTGLDLDTLRDKFGFEIVSAQEDGFVIVASEDLQLTAFLRMVNDFASVIHGSAVIAQIHELADDPSQEGRLARILSESPFAAWPTIDENREYVVNVGIACAGTREIPEPPNPPSPRGVKEKDAAWAKRQATWEAKQENWKRERAAAYMAWDEIKEEREGRVNRFNSRDLQRGDPRHHRRGTGRGGTTAE